jgi:hypothetical protein
MVERILSAAALRELLSPPPRGLVTIDAEILITDGQYFFHHRDERGGEQFLPVSPATLFRAFSSEIVDSGFLPSGVCRWGVGSKGDWLLKVVPPGVSSLTISLSAEETAQVDVPLPPMLFAGVGSKFYLWAVRHGPPSPNFSDDSGLYHAPLPNVNPDGAVCYGANTPPTICWSEPETIERGWRLFIGSPFNRDLSGGKSRRHPDNVLHQLQALASAKRSRRAYPLGDLRPIAEQRYPYSYNASGERGGSQLTVAAAIERYLK